jgi:hypothetical protein
LISPVLSLDIASMRLLVLQNEGELHSAEPFDVLVSDVDILLESKPEGKVSASPYLTASVLMVFFRMKL